VDVALATPEDSRFVTPEIAGVGVVTGIADAVLGETVYKSGRTTGVTSGTVAGTDATVDVWYDGFVGRFVNQYIVQPGTFSAPGDSGSLVLDEQHRAVGLLFAGSERDTIVNPMASVVALTGIDPVLSLPEPPPVGEPPAPVSRPLSLMGLLLWWAIGVLLAVAITYARRLGIF
jgi:hypothetical protein